MSRVKNLIEEDWERVSQLESIYLQEEEDRIWHEIQYIESQEADIVVEEEEEGTIMDVKPYHLPF